MGQVRGCLHGGKGCSGEGTSCAEQEGRGPWEQHRGPRWVGVRSGRPAGWLACDTAACGWRACTQSAQGRSRPNHPAGPAPSFSLWGVHARSPALPACAVAPRAAKGRLEITHSLTHSPVAGRYQKLQGRLKEEKRAAKLLRAQLADERAAAAGVGRWHGNQRAVTLPGAAQADSTRAADAVGMYPPAPGSALPCTPVLRPCFHALLMQSCCWSG